MVSKWEGMPGMTKLNPLINVSCWLVARILALMCLNSWLTSFGVSCHA